MTSREVAKSAKFGCWAVVVPFAVFAAGMKTTLWVWRAPARRGRYSQYGPAIAGFHAHLWAEGS